MKKDYQTPAIVVVDLEIEHLMLTNSGGYTGATIPDIEWHAPEKRETDWDRYEKN